MDEKLAPLFELLWPAGIRTIFSCQCHPPSGKVWIAFQSGRDAELFLTAVLEGGPDDEWARAERWLFSAFETAARALPPPMTRPRHPAGWEFFASIRETGMAGDAQVAIGIDVLFPTEDLPRVIDRVGRSLGRT